jgi:hypothetical protein
MMLSAAKSMAFKISLQPFQMLQAVSTLPHTLAFFTTTQSHQDFYPSAA